MLLSRSRTLAVLGTAALAAASVTSQEAAPVPSNTFAVRCGTLLVGDGSAPQHNVWLVVRDGKPWFLVEVKHHDESINDALRHFQDQTKAPFAFQVVIDADYVDADCFAKPCGPVVVPARTLLSQLL